jgi:hypothetical protein
MNRMNQSRRVSAGVVARLAGGPLTAGLSSEQHDQRQCRAAHQFSRRQVVDVGDAVDVRPQTGQQQDRQADVNEDQQGEEAVVDRIRGEEIARRGFAEDRQPVEQFGGGNRRVLRQLIPDDPVAADAAAMKASQISGMPVTQE